MADRNDSTGSSGLWILWILKFSASHNFTITVDLPTAVQIFAVLILLVKILFLFIPTILHQPIIDKPIFLIVQDIFIWDASQVWAISQVNMYYNEHKCVLLIGYLF